MKSSVSGGKRKSKQTKTGGKLASYKAKHLANQLKAFYHSQLIHVDEKLFDTNPQLLQEVKDYNISVHNFIHHLNKN